MTLFKKIFSCSESELAYHQLGHEQAAIADLQKAAEYFAFHRETAAYDKTLDYLKNLRQQLPFLSEIALI